VAPLFSRCKHCGAGAAGILYRRAQPEIIKRVLLTNGLTTPATAAWTFGVWSQILTAAEFGAVPLWLRGLIAANNANATLTTNATLVLNREFVYNIGTGLVATPPTPIEQVHAHQAAYISIAGIVDDAVTVTALAHGSERLHIARRLIAANTPIAVRSAKSDGNVASSSGIYLVFYPDPLYDFYTLDPAKISTASVFPTLADWTCASGAGTGVFGAYTDIWPSPFTAPADYLCDSVTMFAADSAPGLEAQFDLAVGAPGSEDVHARAAITRPSVLTPGGRNEFPEPWRINAGDRVRVRVAGRIGGPLNYFGTLQLREILP